MLGGCGLGLGYITPVSTLIKWFPDRRGMATGMAIMGFGGGAMIASPLSQLLLDHYKSATSVGVAETFMTLGLIYLVAMLSGAFLFRVPAQGWKPAGWEPPVSDRTDTGHPPPRARGHGDQDRPRFTSSGPCCSSTSRRASGSWSRRHR